MVRRGLGRGLATLLGEKAAAQLVSESPLEPVATIEASDSPVREIAVESISPNPYQPRIELDPDALEELAQSIRQHGLLEPVLVRLLDPVENTYQLIAGERRLRASQLAGLQRVPVIIHEASDAEMLEIAIVENVQRENLNPIEEARAYRRLLEGVGEGGAGLTQQEVAERVGKSRAAVANLLRLLDLPDYVQETVQNGALSQGHAKILAGLDGEKCQQAWTYVLENKASVRDLEHFLATPVAQPSSPSVTRSKPKSHTTQPALDTHWLAIQEAIQERLRTKITLRKNKDDSGVIEVHFFNSEDLDRLLESLDIEL